MVPLEAETCSKLLTSIKSLMGGFQGTFTFLRLDQSIFLNHAWSLIYFPLSLEPNLLLGFGFNSCKIKCLARSPKN